MAQEDWDLLWSLAYILALCIALFMAFYDRKNFPKTTWAFNPKRGVLYFFFGWMIFPIIIGVDLVLGADFNFAGMVFGTLFMSIFIGILGTFTENIGV